MRTQLTRGFNFLWSTAIGGVFFLVPLAVVLFLLGELSSAIVAVAGPLMPWLPVHSVLGATLLFLVALAVLIALCFVGGVIARRAIGRRFSSVIEKRLSMVFPKYLIYKDLLADNLRVDGNAPTLAPVWVRSLDGWRIAMEADRLPNGMVVLFLPGAPDAWIGSVVVVPSADVRPSSIAFGEAIGICERLGRDSNQLLSQDARNLN